MKKSRTKVRRQVDPKALGWPSDEQASSGFWCNHCYQDLRGLSWQEARKALGDERSLMQRINDSEDAVATIEEIADEFYEDQVSIHMVLTKELLRRWWHSQRWAAFR